MMCYGECVEKLRLDNFIWNELRLSYVFTAIPKRLLPPYRVVNPRTFGGTHTTLCSVIGHAYEKTKPALSFSLRKAGRAASRISTPLLIVEGYWDLTILMSCIGTCLDCKVN